MHASVVLYHFMGSFHLATPLFCAAILLVLLNGSEGDCLPEASPGGPGLLMAGTSFRLEVGNRSARDAARVG